MNSTQTNFLDKAIDYIATLASSTSPKQGSKNFIFFNTADYYTHNKSAILSLILSHTSFITDFSALFHRGRAREREMGSNEEREGSKPTSGLPLFSLPALRNLKHSGNLSSPLHTHASVPFRWEEQPGKPRPSTALALPSAITAIPKFLDLPPRLLFAEAKLTTKTPSPTTVLEGPNNSVGRSIPFSLLRKGQLPSHKAPEGGFLGTVVPGNKKDKGLFGPWRKKKGGSSIKNSSTESEVHGGNLIFSSVSDDGTGGCNGGATMTVATVSGKRGVSGVSQAKSHFWVSLSACQFL